MWEQLINNILEHMGFREFRVEVDEEHRNGSIFIYDNPKLIEDNLPMIVESFNHLGHILAQKHNIEPLYFDVNHYRKERERLLTELARAAARKAVATKESVSLPAMNSYERMVVHTELATRPDVKTESEGERKERHIVVSPL